MQRRSYSLGREYCETNPNPVVLSEAREAGLGGK